MKSRARKDNRKQQSKSQTTGSKHSKTKAEPQTIADGNSETDSVFCFFVFLFLVQCLRLLMHSFNNEYSHVCVSASESKVSPSVLLPIE